MKKLRLVLGDQLNYQHSWYSKNEEDVVYFLAEMRQETDYVKHHIQKVVAFFESMTSFTEWLRERGHRVIYYSLDSEDNKQDLQKNLSFLIKDLDIEKFEYQLPDEYRLDQQLREFCESLNIPSESYNTEHFLSERNDVANFFAGKKEMTMEYFYRSMRKKYEILMVNDKDPEGGKWNFDASNRKKWKGSPDIPHERGFRKDISETYNRIKKAGVETIGNIDPSSFNWPTSREECLSVLRYFCNNLLVHFGDYQDAMHTEEKFLFHSRLSFALNTKILHPMEVIESVIDHWREHKDVIDISQVEGFVRQILGWREFMRGVYWKEMPSYATLNKLENTNKLPEFFWTGETSMNCMHHAISQSLDTAYAHHIQRLMITGNYALLTQCDPDEVDSWYLGVYIDAIQWVEITNTRGMSQFADGGIIATKPYVSSGNYINKQSNYCGNCQYDVNKKVGENACPFNSLYWNFLDDKKEYFKNNRRMGMMLNLLKKKSAEEISEIKQRAADIIANPDKY
ncbi:MAG: cryptochrome/photolyase family protein [Bacteroidia bacterium]|nr:cryptochrome/photolyase family protein [Bacteroidia bacterium]NNF32021.1 cryptochrome/photolyase family protein [Flavobacteriaceae bacterium]NNJ80728.1 cryptochrome/photolyase family protein [Flavobacteriaceae bacterium]NNK53459.1 cryptochrome/photolyase family protein [Flavobacteriaceae bacterium]